MELEEAIRGRMSVRAYKADPVPKEILTKIMEAAIHTGSSANMQPWSFDIVGGKALAELREAMSEKTRSGAEANTEVPIYTSQGIYHERRRKVLGKMYDALGISRNEPEKRLFWFMKMDRFLEAPNLILLSVEKALAPWVIMDAGMIMDAIMLLAHSRGLGTCVMGRAVQYPDVLRQRLHIPENKLIVIGIAIGYPDFDAAVNKFRSDREPLETFVSWHGL
ncbi:MAG: nitroreductase [Dehalococcoidia bacterium]|nr:nitroreductase [Dehalococcoidia bacterium]